MEIQLSWDLVIIIFLVLVLSYSFIIGKSHSAKLIFSCYLSYLAADALGNVIKLAFNENSPLVQFFSISNLSGLTIIIKIVFFTLFMVLFAIRGVFDIALHQERPIVEVLLTLYFGFLNGMLIMSVLFLFISGTSFFASPIISTGNPLEPLIQNSEFVRLLVGNINVWFTLPPLTFIAMSFSKDGNIHVHNDE